MQYIFIDSRPIYLPPWVGLSFADAGPKATPTLYSAGKLQICYSRLPFIEIHQTNIELFSERQNVQIVNLSSAVENGDCLHLKEYRYYTIVNKQHYTSLYQ